MKKLFIFILFFTLLNAGGITKEQKVVEFIKDGKKIRIARENKTIPKEYLNPTIGYIAPMKIDKNIETIAELEVINYLKESTTNDNIVVVDARTPDWYEKIKIPTAINLPYTLFQNKENAIDTLLMDLGVNKNNDGSLDFSNAKTIVVYCNGAWCLQSIMLIKDAKYSLLKLGYPKDKIKYYRGGMQSWVVLGLTTQGKE